MEEIGTAAAVPAIIYAASAIYGYTQTAQCPESTSAEAPGAVTTAALHPPWSEEEMAGRLLRPPQQQDAAIDGLQPAD